jgi:hypothetical protein
LIWADAGHHEQPGLLVLAARRLRPRPLDAAGGPGQAPKNPYIANNIRLLEESAHKAKGVN